MSSSADLRPVARRTLPVRTEAQLLAAGWANARFARSGTAATERPAERSHTTSRAPGARGGLTLDDVLSGAWEALTAHGPAPCPICGGAMRPRYGSGPVVVAARCGSCSTTLL